jgi:predicted aminopeptidase
VALPGAVLVGAIWLVLSGCESLGYYGQAVSGEWRVLRNRVPIEKLRSDPRTDPKLASRLATVESILDFASARLALPAQGRYRTYADVGSGPIVWNVFAADEFSVDAHEWCYPIVGCAAYRGYFHRDAALRESLRRSRSGQDVRVSGVAAYSTLGWFHDPVLSSFVDWPDAELAGLLMHELAHVEVFVKGDTDFNESYASFVAREGVREWITVAETRQDLARWRDEVARDDRFSRFMLRWRAALARLYAQPYPEFARRLLKSDMLAAVERCYRDQRALLGARTEMTAALNNADFVPWAAYEGWLPAFATLFRDENRDWASFHRRVAALGDLAPGPREAALRALADRAGRSDEEGSTVSCESIEPSDLRNDSSPRRDARESDG